MGKSWTAIKGAFRLIRNKERRKQLIGILSDSSMQNRIFNNYTVPDNESKYILLKSAEIIALFPDLKKIKIALVGGCEFEYANKILQENGLQSYHTFTDAGATNPYLELTSDSSKIWEYKPNIVVFSVSDIIRKEMKDIQDNRAKIESQNKALSEIKEFTRAIAKIVGEKLQGIAVVSTYDLLFRPIGGSIDYKRQTDRYSLSEFTRRFELALYELTREIKNLIVLDLAQIFSIAGKLNALQLFEDNAYWTHYNRTGAEYMVSNLLKQIIVLDNLGKRIKCVVVDLDNTLWEGILRDDGIKNLRIRFDRLEILKLLKARGIMIAICSKNDPSDIPLIEELLNVKEIKVLYDVPNPFANEVFPYKDLFIIKKINWQDKSLNIQEIAKELNIGLDTFAFFDDSPFEREQVEQFLPRVTVFPEWALKDALLLPQFEPLPQTKESAQRTEMMKADQVRTIDESKFQGDKETFLKSCQMKLWIRPVKEQDLNRVFEMIQRTNQLNITTKRYSMAEIEKMFKSQKHNILIADLVDKYGEYGTIGLAIVEKGVDVWKLDTYLFSCRIMGKTVEKTMLLFIMNQAKQANAKKISGAYCKTEKNQLMEKFFAECNFQQNAALNSKDETVWEYDLTSKKIESYPVWFEFVNF